MRKGCLLLWLVVCVLMLVGCRFSFFDTDGSDLMKMPAVTDTDRQILDAMADMTEGDYSLVYALRGKMQNPIRFCDLNGDGQDEILVFYRSARAHPSAANSVCMAIFVQTENGLERMADVIGNGVDLDCFDFQDFDENGTLDLVVGYITSASGKTLAVYLLDVAAKTCRESYVRGYTDWMLTDITNSGVPELVFAHYDALSSYAYARLVRYNPETGTFDELGGNNNLIYSSDVYSMQAVPTSSSMFVLLITAKRNTLLSSTEVLVWDDVTNQLLNMAMNDASIYGDSVVDGLKDSYCSLGSYLPFDIDGDGYTEIPICLELDEAKVSMESFLGQETMKYPYTWCEFRYDFIADFTAYMNENQYYFLKIPSSWDFSHIRVYANYRNDLYFYYVSDPEMPLPSQRVPLFSIQQTSGAKVRGGYQLAYISENNLCYSLVTLLSASDPQYESLKHLIPSGDAVKEQFVIAEIPVA